MPPQIETIPSPLENRNLDRILAAIAWFCWILTLVIVSFMVWRRPEYRNECLVYGGAAHDWWTSTGLYTHNLGIDGFLYFPQSALLYSPFAIIPRPASDLVWRAAGMALFASGLVRLSGWFAGPRKWAMFAVFTIVALPPAMACVRNGQANLHIAGMMLHTVLSLQQKRWGKAAFWLVIGVLLKPIMLVMLLLAAVWYWRLIPRLAIGLALAMLLPFAFQRPHFVLDQYIDFFHMTMISSNPNREFCNIHGLLATTLRWTLSGQTFQIIGLIAAAATLGIWLWTAPRQTEAARPLFLMAYTVCYLLLFNPRTQSNSYVMLAPLLGIAVTLAFYKFHRLGFGAILIVMIVCLTCDGWAYKWTENWLKPMECIVFTVMLIIASTRRLEVNFE
jgi:hypothetical protein